MGSEAGTFVELGAYTGVQLSNTYLLEKCFQWRGLLIEANPSNYAELAHSKRNHSRFMHAAVCAKGIGSINVTAGQTETSGSPTEMAESFRKRFEKTNTRNTVAVPCAPLSLLMDEANLPKATFLSLDVEVCVRSVWGLFPSHCRQ